MATRKTSKNFVLIPTEYLNRNLSQSAQQALNAVCAGSRPASNVSWTDLYAIFRNSRQLVRETNRLNPSADRDLQIMIDIMREDHGRLRGLLFLVAVETLFDLGVHNTRELLWTYGECLELVDRIPERLAETEEEIAQVKAHFGNVVCV